MLEIVSSYTLCLLGMREKNHGIYNLYHNSHISVVYIFVILSKTISVFFKIPQRFIHSIKIVRKNLNDFKCNFILHFRNFTFIYSPRKTHR